jgi:hypothetical protein
MPTDLGSPICGAAVRGCSDSDRRVSNARCFFVAGILFAVAPLGSTESVKISVSPAQSIGPANLHIRVTVEPNAMNRALGVAAESEDYVRSSEVALEGDRGPRTVIFEFRSVPSGHYEIRGGVGDASGHEVATTRQNAFVWSSGSER